MAGKVILLEGFPIDIIEPHTLRNMLSSDIRPNTKSILIPDAEFIADCRQSMTKDSRMFNHFIMSRRDINIILLAQSYNHLNKFIRSEIDSIVRLSKTSEV